MERRYELRLEQMLVQAKVAPELVRGLLRTHGGFTNESM